MPSGNREELIFLHALGITPANERDAYVQKECGDDRELLERVRALLWEQELTEGPLDAPPTGVRSPPSDSASYANQQIGPYKLLQQIGEGGFGVVYMADQLHPVKRRVAFKVIKPGMDTKEVVARFEAERQALALMDHVNIANVLDGGTTDSGRPYFVMELVKGVGLTEFCDHNRLSMEQRLELFGKVCRAIQHAHQKGVIHRDIKPSNVMVLSLIHI